MTQTFVDQRNQKMFQWELGQLIYLIRVQEKYHTAFGIKNLLYSEKSGRTNYMSLTFQFILLIVFLIVVAKSGSQKGMKEMDKAMDIKLKQEAEQRILNSRIRKERGL